MFEPLLAWRYIREQKRHSLLTICSIILAVAMLTMFFTGAACVFNTGRYTIATTQFPHHAVAVVTDEQEAEIAAMEGVKAVGNYTPGELHPNDPGSSYADSYIAKDIDNAISELELTGTQHAIWIDFAFHLFVKDAGARLPLGHPSAEAVFNDISNMTWAMQNWILMNVDLLTTSGRFTIAVLFTLYYVLVIFIALMLRLVIDTAFEISAKERERQFGVLQSVGATPKQIVRIMTNEGLMLSAAGLPLGLLAGIGLAYFLYRADAFRMIAEFIFYNDFITPPFHVSALSLFISAATGLLWVLFSAYGTGVRVMKYTPIEAIYGKQTRIMKVKRHSIFGLLFGWTGKLAARNVARQKKRFLITVLSLTLSITLIASASFVISAFREAAVADAYAGAGEIWSFDLEAYVTADDTSPFAYRDGVQKLTETGLFSEVTPELGAGLRVPDYEQKSIYYPYYGYKAIGSLNWLNETDYNALFKGVPPVSYQELCDSGKYIWATPAGSSLAVSDLSADGGKSVDLCLYRERLISEAQARKNAEIRAEKLLEHDPDTVIDMEELMRQETRAVGWDAEHGEYIRDYMESFDEEMNFPLLCDASGTLEIENYGMETFVLVAPEQAYEAGGWQLTLLEGTDRVSFPSYTLRCRMQVRDLDHVERAKQAIESLGVYARSDDHISAQLHAEQIAETILFICRILMALFALVALVNMVNIITTGILNRRQELASMCTLGMTDGQLIRMILTECLQYVLTSGICAALLCAALIFFTKKMLIEVTLEEYITQLGLSYLRPLPAVAIATACAFFAAAAASLLSLRRLMREPLIDGIRRTE